MALPTSVAPFILRGVTLAGVDSVFMPLERRLAAYNKFSPILADGKLDLLAGDDKTVGLSGTLELANQMLQVSTQYNIPLGACPHHSHSGKSDWKICGRCQRLIQ